MRVNDALYFAMFQKIIEDILTIKARDPAARNVWEVLTCYPGLHALINHRLAHCLWRMKLKWLARFLAYLSRMLTGIEIHPGAQIGRGVFIDHGHGVVIGETAQIGDQCTIYQGVTLGGTTLTRGEKRHPTLERGVIIGAGAKVLGAFTVGEYAKVGSNAVVVRAVAANTTVVGNPAYPVDSGETVNKDRNEFTGYGVSANVDDPIQVALAQLQKEVSELRAQLDIKN